VERLSSRRLLRAEVDAQSRLRSLAVMHGTLHGYPSVIGFVGSQTPRPMFSEV